MNKILIIAIIGIVVTTIISIPILLLFQSVPNDPIGIVINRTIPIESEINKSTNITNPIIIPPTQLENLTTILLADPGSECEYVKDEHDCVHFSIDLAINLTALGYDCGCLRKTPKIRGLSGHQMVWVNINNSTYYIEPQSDKIMTPESFTSNINPDHYVIREIPLEQAIRNEAESRQWRK